MWCGLQCSTTSRHLPLARSRFSLQTNTDTTKSVILVGTGEPNSSGDSYYGLGILRSADGGSTWTAITQDVGGVHSFAGLGFSKIAFSTSNPQLVVAATAAATQGFVLGLESPVTVNRGIYYSQDAGVTWHYASVKDGSSTVSPGSVTSVVYNAERRQILCGVALSRNLFVGGWNQLDATC